MSQTATNIVVQVEYINAYKRTTDVVAQVEYFNKYKRITNVAVIVEYTEGTEVNDSRTAFLSGNSSTTTNQTAYLLGKPTTSHAFMYGQAVIQSDIPVFLCGGERDSISAYLNGYAIINAFQSDSFSNTAFQVGNYHKSSTPVFLQGKDTGTLNISKTSAFVQGKLSDKDNATAFICGQIIIQSTASVFLHGVEAAQSYNNAYIKGKAEITTASPVFLEGTTKTTSFISVYLCGKVDSNNSISGYLQGIADANTSNYCFIYGAIEVKSSISAFLPGLAKSSTPSYLCGSANANTNTFAYLHGASKTASSISAFLPGRTESNVLSYLYGSANTDTNIPVYLHGANEAISSISAILLGQIESSILSYLYGVAVTSSSISGYIHGQARLSTNTMSYLAGGIVANTLKYGYLFGNLFGCTSIPILLNGNILVLSAQTAFITGLTQTVNSLVNAYISGVVKTQTRCYLSGQIVNVDYIWLKTSDNGITKSKKFKVLTESYEELTRTRNENVNKTISGGIDHSIGENSTAWRMIIRVKTNELDTDYGNLSDLEYFYGLNNPKAVPSNDIIFIDHHQYEYITHIIGTFKKSLMTTVIEGQQALYFCSLEVQKI